MKKELVGTGKTALITGATSGFGGVIAKHLVEKGYTLIVLGRSKEKLKTLIADLKEVSPNGNIDSVRCNLSSLNSIEKACISIQQTHKSIDLLILNAGIWNFKYVETEDNIEETLQVNLLAPVLMFKKLYHLLQRNGDSKVIFTSSGLHQGKINFSDLEFKKAYSGFKSYRQSKLGLILIARLFSKKEEFNGISFFTVHPGMVNTNLGRNAGWFSKLVFKLLGKTKQKGAQTHLFLIDQPNESLISGEYYANSRITKTTKESHSLESAKKLLDRVNDILELHRKNGEGS